MRWHVDISSIGSGAPKTRFCVEAEQWQKALQLVRAKRGDDGPFGHFSIELLDEGFRAIDPLTRTRYVVQQAPDDAPLSEGESLSETASPKTEAADEEKTSVGGRPKGRSSAASGPGSRPKPRASNRGTTSRASERGRIARGKAPSIPDDPVPRAAEPSKATAKLDGGRTLASQSEADDRSEGSTSNGAAVSPSASKPVSTPPPRTEVPLVAPKPMQAETAFERMTGGSAVALPTTVSPSADLKTEVLPMFKVLSRRSEDPTPTSPLTYREMALAVASTTSLQDAEAIARAQFEIIRNAIGGAPKGKFIQLAVFDHEFTGKPSAAPIVTLSFKDWRNVEPDLRFPQRDGAAPASMRPSIASVPPASMPAPPTASTAAPSTIEAPTVPVLADTVVRNIVPGSLARPTVEPPTVPAETVPETAPPAPEAAATPEPEPEPPAEVIKPAPIIAIGGSTEPETSAKPAEPAPSAEAVPASAPEEAAPPPVPAVAPEDAAPATVPSQPPPVSLAPAAPEPPPPSAPSSPPPAPPAPTPSQLRANAKEMAGDDEKTLVKPSSPPPAAQASQPPPEPPPNEHVVNKTTKMAAVSAPPPPAPAPSAPPPAGAQTPSQIPPAPPVARVPSVPPPGPARPASIPPSSLAQPQQARPASIPPPAAPLLVRQPIGPRRSGDDLITDLFEACSDLAFLNDTFEAADFVLALVLDSIPSAVALCSFFDINTREMVVVRQAVSPGFAALPNVLTARASEFTPLIAKTMRAGRSIVVPATDCGVFSEDARWRALGHAPKSAISTPIAAGGRYLGLLEVADPLDEAPFTEADGHALTYIGGQFSEHLAQREIDLTPERIRRPKLNQLARR